MHGVKKREQTAQELQLQKQQAEKYLSLNSILLASYRAGDFALSNLEQLNQAQLLAPLDNTLWNYRIKIIQQNISVDLLNYELRFVLKALSINPKIYTVWEYRKFLVKSLHSLSSDPLQNELLFMEKILKNDRRNFHCWNYRRYLANLLFNRKTLPNDFENTKHLIQEDFSSYSAFYHRYLCLQEDGTEQQKEEEMKFVKECLYISPNDESLWTYFALLCKEADIEFVRELIDSLDEYDHRPLIYFAKICLDLKLKHHFGEARVYLGLVSGVLQQGVVEELLLQINQFE
ncbi:Protein_geranylgeranyltransferase/Protein farnesyltransferase [Hexamita inflata]|uniref:Geranylgeranyl transferase type-2 subunit alpha n=1 Tax=Hexamita inflata TaxID=28002 RepID=A0ABP1HCD3_9EUKA